MGKTEYHQRIGRKIEVLVICVNYGDFLKITLPRNKKQIEDITVITSFNDKETIDICNQNDVDYILTDELFRNMSNCVKGAGYTVGFNFLHYKDWILLLDADIVLNENFGDYINNNICKFNPECLYGSIRYVIRNYSNFLLFENKEINIKDLEIGLDSEINGYFQLFNFNKFKNDEVWNIHPQSATGEDDDVIFSLKFGNNYIENGKWICDENFHKKLDLPVLHLGEIAVNHKKRISKRFE